MLFIKSTLRVMPRGIRFSFPRERPGLRFSGLFGHEKKTGEA